MYIYAIQIEETGPIKIGRSSRPESRIEQLQGASPFNLNLISSVAEERSLREKKIHTHLSNYRIKGEWFLPAGYVLRITKLMNNDVETLIELIKQEPAIPSPSDYSLCCWEQLLKNKTEEIKENIKEYLDSHQQVISLLSEIDERK